MTKEPTDRSQNPLSDASPSSSDYRIDDEVTSARRQAESEAKADIAATLSEVPFGFVNFDSGRVDSMTSGLMIPKDMRSGFRREVYIGINDNEQATEFLGRIVEGPFHTPHEVSADSALTRTTVLHPDRTKFRPSYYVYGTVEILGEIREGERIVPTATRPRPYAQAYLFPAKRLEAMLGLGGDLLLGHLMRYENVVVRADGGNKNFLPRNVGVFGTVGSGKSNTTQVVIEEAIDAGWAVVVIDVEGEYVCMDEPTSDPAMTAILSQKFEMKPGGVAGLRVYVPQGGSSESSTARNFKVPISRIDPIVLSEILKDLSEPQERMLTLAIARAERNAQFSNTGSRMGPLSQAQGEDDTSRPYTLQTLIDGLDEHEDFPLLKSKKRSPSNTEKPTARVLRRKLMRLGYSNMLDWNETASVPELPIPKLLEAGRLSILDVSDSSDTSRNIAIAYTLQALFDEVVATPLGELMPNGLARPKLMVVVEEVHTFVSRSRAARMRAVIDQLQVISRRGRKRWMALALVSQQPGHVPDELFELVNTRFIHQLKSAANLAPVRQTTGGVHEALWQTVPALGPGQCLLAGATFRNPVFVTLRPAKSRRLYVD